MDVKDAILAIYENNKKDNSNNIQSTAIHIVIQEARVIEDIQGTDDHHLIVGVIAGEDMEIDIIVQDLEAIDIVRVLINHRNLAVNNHNNCNNNPNNNKTK